MSEHEIDPDELTSPGTISDPELERRRAKEAAEREAESRASDASKFEETLEEQQEERRKAARAVGDVPPPRED